MELTLVILILIFILVTPVILIIIGLAKMANKDPAKKKTGKYLLLIGVIIALLEILVGYSICSGFRIH